MKTKSLLALIGVSVIILSSALVLIAAVVVLDNRELRREVRTLRMDLQQARADVSQLHAEATDAAAQMAAKHDRLQQLEEEVARPKAADVKAPDEAGAAAAPRAYRVRTYLGKQYLGMGWLVPSVLPKNGESGKVAYEPVLVLDESLKRNFVVHQTNVVEREGSRETTINYNYPYPSAYWYPAVFFPGTNKLAKCNTNLPPRLAPRAPQPGVLSPKPFLNTKLFLPNAKPFLPPEPVKIQAGPRPWLPPGS